jgi:hypothetical protein
MTNKKDSGVSIVTCIRILTQHLPKETKQYVETLLWRQTHSDKIRACAQFLKWYVMRIVIFCMKWAPRDIAILIAFEHQLHVTHFWHSPGKGLDFSEPDVSLPTIIGFSKWPNPSSRTMALVSIQALTEISTRNLPGSKGQLAHKADNLTAIFEQVV